MLRNTLQTTTKALSRFNKSNAEVKNFERRLKAQIERTREKR